MHNVLNVQSKQPQKSKHHKGPRTHIYIYNSAARCRYTYIAYGKKINSNTIMLLNYIIIFRWSCGNNIIYVCLFFFLSVLYTPDMKKHEIKWKFIIINFGSYAHARFGPPRTLLYFVCAYLVL